MKLERKEKMRKCDYVKMSDNYVLHTTKTE